MRGAQDRQALQLVFAGSSPRMRGALHQAVKQWADDRIIPADAGSTDYVWRNDVLFQDHPRGCGEHQTLPSLSM